jgi:hypothetical protein
MPKVKLEYVEKAAAAIKAAGDALLIDPRTPTFNAAYLRAAGEKLNDAASALRNLGAELEDAINERD